MSVESVKLVIINIFGSWYVGEDTNDAIGRMVVFSEKRKEWG